jgi:hypothetical protein
LKLTVRKLEMESRGLEPKYVKVSSLKLSVVTRALGFWRLEILIFTKAGFV